MLTALNNSGRIRRYISASRRKTNRWRTKSYIRRSGAARSAVCAKLVRKIDGYVTYDNLPSAVSPGPLLPTQSRQAPNDFVKLCMGHDTPTEILLQHEVAGYIKLANQRKGVNLGPTKT